MGIFKRRPTNDPDDLLHRLVATCRNEDWEQFANLCRSNQQLIIENFAVWRTVPESVTDRSATDHYVHTLVCIASAFERAGRPELMELIVGTEGSNPLAMWQNDYEQAEALVNAGDFQSAIVLLGKCLEKYEGAAGPGADHFLPRTHGLLGVAHHGLGNVPQAVAHTRAALDICVRLEDAAGTETYRRNIEALDRDPDAT